MKIALDKCASSEQINQTDGRFIFIFHFYLKECRFVLNCGSITGSPYFGLDWVPSRSFIQKELENTHLLFVLMLKTL